MAQITSAAEAQAALREAHSELTTAQEAPRHRSHSDQAANISVAITKVQEALSWLGAVMHLVDHIRHPDQPADAPSEPLHPEHTTEPGAQA
jgi:hypothetical protein